MFMVCQNFSLINNCFVIFVTWSWYHDENSQSDYDPIHFYTRKKNPLNGMITTADLANWPLPCIRHWYGEFNSCRNMNMSKKVVYKRGSSVSWIRNKTIALYACIDLRNCAPLTRCLADWPKLCWEYPLFLLYTSFLHSTAQQNCKRKCLCPDDRSTAAWCRRWTQTHFRELRTWFQPGTCLPDKIVIGMVSIMYIDCTGG